MKPLSPEEQRWLGIQVDMAMDNLHELVATRFNLPEEASNDSDVVFPTGDLNTATAAWVEKYRPDATAPAPAETKAKNQEYLLGAYNEDGFEVSGEVMYYPSAVAALKDFAANLDEREAGGVMGYLVMLCDDTHEPRMTLDRPRPDHDEYDKVLVWTMDHPRHGFDLTLVSRGENYEDCRSQALSRLHSQHHNGHLELKNYLAAVAWVMNPTSARHLVDGCVVA